MEAQSFYGSSPALDIDVAAVQPTDKEPTEEPSKQEVIEPTEKVEEPTQEAREPETVQVIELDDKEVSLEDVRKWRDGHMMKETFYKKTEDLANERKAFDAERESERKALADEKAKTAEMRDLLEVLVKEDDIDWDELWESDPDEWKARQETAKKRKKALDELKASRQSEDPEVIRKEQEKLFLSMEWVADGKLTDKYEADKTLIESYAVKEGYSPEEFVSMTRAHQFTTLWKAAKYDELQEKSREVQREREKVPVVTKPKPAKAQGEQKTLAQIMYGT